MGVVAALVGLLSLQAAVASAQETGPEPDVRVVVSALDGVLVTHGVERERSPADLSLRLLVENRGAAAVDDLTVLVEVFRRARFRSQLHDALDRGVRPRGLLEAERFNVFDGAELAPGDVAGVEVDVAAASIGWSDTTGVHPVRVSVERGGSRLDTVTTAVVVQARAPKAPVAALVGWPLDAAPWRSPGGDYPAAVAQELAPGGRLDLLLAALERRADVPVQLLPAAHLVEDLADRADGFQESDGNARRNVAPDDPPAVRSRRALERLQALVDAAAPPVTGPYADTDLASLLAEDLPLEAVRSVSQAPARLHAALGRPPLPDVLWATTPLDRATVHDVLEPSGVSTILLGWEQLAEADDREAPAATPQPVQVVRAAGVDVLALVADPWLTSLLEAMPNEHGPIVAIQRILAETAQIHLEAPDNEGRAVVMLPPPRWEPGPRVAAQLLRGLERADWLELGGVEQVLDAYAGTPGATGLAGADSDRLPADLVRSLTSTRERLTALKEAVPGDRAGGRTWDELELTLLRAPSTWWLERRPDRSRSMVQAVDDTIDEALGTITLPRDARITLTDTDQQVIPVTLSRPEGGPIRVVVELDASRKVRFPEGDAQLVTLDQGARQTISIPVIPQAAGRIPVRVLIKTPGAIDPEGTPWLQVAESTIVVQSTAVSGNALVTVGGVFALLLLWWLYRRLRPKPPQLTVVREHAA
ncbi:MAG TPA: hypothetical protein VHF25_06585 [Nitriliruptorales bacterium]|nr:hypothetical protein [Nitriliruptorales bacterium]